MRLSVRDKIILPFALLLLLVGVLGTGVASTELTSEASAEFSGRLLRSSLNVNQSLSQLDANRAADLRLATDTLGVPEALAGNDLSSLARLLEPVVANIPASTAQLKVVDLRGQVVLHIQEESGGPSVAQVTAGDSLSQSPEVMHVLNQAPTSNDRLAFVWVDSGTPVLFWAGPVRLGDGQTVGAALIGESLKEIAKSMPSSAFYDLSGREVASALASAPVLTSTVQKQITTARATQTNQTIDGQPYGALFSSWAMRGKKIGYVAVEESEAALVALRDQLRLVLTLIFTGAAVLTLLVGSATALMLTRPIQSLMQSMRAVTGGDLQHRARIRSQDEIGFLAKAFNDMTASLEDKTAALEQTTFAAIEALARAIDARDPMTFGHSERVAAISVEIADAMFVPEKEREALRRAALLHDLGKIGVQDRVLRKPGPLNATEAGEMREHSQVGYDILKCLPFLKASLPGVLYHHERWDGAGYPVGLRGTSIPLQVRILSVADVLDAMCSDRPYRSGLSFDAAVAEIRNDAGLRFDPDVVTAFLTKREAIRNILTKMGTHGAMQAEPEAA